MCTKSVKFGLDQALHHLLCMRTGKPMPYIIKAKWYVRTVCSHRHSSGGNSSCMAPTDVNLFWALSICHQCPTCSAAWKFERKIYWSFPGSAHKRELLRFLGRREWSATSANWKVPRCKSRVTTLSRSHRLSSNTSLARVTAVSWIHQALVDHFANPLAWAFCWFLPVPPPPPSLSVCFSLSLSLSLHRTIPTFLCIFRFCICFLL